MGQHIFLVEDTDGDALLIEEAFRALGRTQHTIERARNSEEAVERLANDNAPALISAAGNPGVGAAFTLCFMPAR